MQEAEVKIFPLNGTDKETDIGIQRTFLIHLFLYVNVKGRLHWKSQGNKFTLFSSLNWFLGFSSAGFIFRFVGDDIACLPTTWTMLTAVEHRAAHKLQPDWTKVKPQLVVCVRREPSLFFSHSRPLLCFAAYH